MTHPDVFDVVPQKLLARDGWELQGWDLLGHDFNGLLGSKIETSFRNSHFHSRMNWGEKNWWNGVVWGVWCGVAWCGVIWWVQCGVVWCGVVWFGGCGVVWCGVVWCGVVWCGVAWCGVAWCGVV